MSQKVQEIRDRIVAHHRDPNYCPFPVEFFIFLEAGKTVAPFFFSIRTKENIDDKDEKEEAFTGAFSDYTLYNGDGEKTTDIEAANVVTIKVIDQILDSGKVMEMEKTYEIPLKRISDIYFRGWWKDYKPAQLVK